MSGSRGGESPETVARTRPDGPPARERGAGSGVRTLHKYAVDQHVRLHPSRFSRIRSSETGVYRVTRLMPFDERGEVSYRICGAGSGERAVRESEIEMRVPAPDGGSSMPLFA